MLMTGESHHVTSFPFPLHYLSVQLNQQQSQSHLAPFSHKVFHLSVVPDKLCIASTVKRELRPQSTNVRHDICSPLNLFACSLLKMVVYFQFLFFLFQIRQRKS